MVSKYFLSSPRNLGKIPNLTNIFSKGLVQPPTSQPVTFACNPQKLPVFGEFLEAACSHFRRSLSFRIWMWMILAWRAFGAITGSPKWRCPTGQGGNREETDAQFLGGAHGVGWVEWSSVFVGCALMNFCAQFFCQNLICTSERRKSDLQNAGKKSYPFQWCS